MTRIPDACFPFRARAWCWAAAKFYPLVGALVALGAIGIERGLRSHLPPMVTALVVLAYLVIITGGFHEDGLADTADALGGGWTQPRMLEIMHDSRIGSFGTLAICLSLLARWVLLGSLPVARFPFYMLAAHVLCRWTTLPLGAFFDFGAQRWPGRQAGAQDFADVGRHRIALAFLIAGWALRMEALVPIAAVSR